MTNIKKRLSMWALAIVCALFVPLVLTLLGSGVDGEGWHWTLFDFIFAFVLLFGAACTYELIANKLKKSAYRVAVGMAVIAVLLLIWINAAVGIIGSEDNPLNLLYFAVPIIGMIGASVARLRPRGMSYALFAMAIAQLMVPVTALIINESQITLAAPGVVGVFGLNIIFALLFIGSALLFQRANDVALLDS
jgi:hypothetical protein